MRKIVKNKQLVKGQSEKINLVKKDSYLDFIPYTLQS